MGVPSMFGAAFTLCALTSGAGPLELEPGDLKPGLIAKYLSCVTQLARLVRVEAKPAFTLGRSSPHPRIPPGPFEVTYTGVLQIKESGPITFSAFVGGELTVTVDGVTVLDGRGQTDTAQVKGKEALKRESGYYTFTVKYQSLVDVPARLQLWWEGEAFAREPLPAWRLGRLAADETPVVKADLAAAAGRTAVREFGCAR